MPDECKPNPRIIERFSQTLGRGPGEGGVRPRGLGSAETELGRLESAHALLTRALAITEKPCGGV